MTVKQKFFSAESHAAAIELATEYFNQEKIYSEVKIEGSDVFPWLVLCINLESRSESYIANLNGEYNLFFEPDGVYLEVYPPRGSGVELNKETVINYILRKNIKQMVLSEVSTLLTKGEGRSKIAPLQEEIILDEDILVATATGDMDAFIQFLPPDKGGEAITADKIINKLSASGIVYGIKNDLIEAAMSEKKYDKRYLIAQGDAAENGEDGSLEFHFDTGIRTLAPKELENGKIDYRQLDLFIPVTTGQLLVTRHLPTQGVPGCTVKGKEIKPKPGKNVSLPKSKNTTTNEEKTMLYSSFNGLVDFTGGSVNVSNIYSVKGDCDMKIGNIDFDGSVMISGSIISGLKIKATGSIVVGGVVEGSEIIAGGNVELKRGIQGIDKGKVTAGGTIKAQFIERASVSAGEDVIADAIIHSKVEAGHSILMNGKRSNIMGGHVRVSSEVIAKQIGSVMHTQTEIEVGLMPQKRVRMQFLQQEIKRLTAELEKISKLETYLVRSATTMDVESRRNMLLSLQTNKSQTTQQYDEYTEEYNNLEIEAVNSTSGRVHVLETIYPGVKITIGTEVYRVTSDITFATFKNLDKEIIYTACEASKNSNK